MRSQVHGSRGEKLKEGQANKELQKDINDFENLMGNLNKNRDPGSGQNSQRSIPFKFVSHFPTPVECCEPGVITHLVLVVSTDFSFVFVCPHTRVQRCLLALPDTTQHVCVRLFV